MTVITSLLKKIENIKKHVISLNNDILYGRFADDNNKK